MEPLGIQQLKYIRCAVIVALGISQFLLCALLCSCKMPPKTSNSKPRSTDATGPPKMRSSCKACADSKIGCTKERPTCSRCERRDVTCVYVATKRAGRPSKNKQRQETPPGQVDGGTSAASACPSSESPTAGWPNDITDSSGIFTPPPSMPQQTLDWCFPAYPCLSDSMSTSAVDKDGLSSSLPSLTQPLSQLLSASPPPGLLDDNRAFNWDAFLFHSTVGHDANGMQLYEKATDSLQDPSNISLTGGNINNETPIPSGSQRTAASPVDSINWFSVTDGANNAFAPTSDISGLKSCGLPGSPSSLNKHSSRGCLARCLSCLDQLTPQWSGASCTQDREKSPVPTSASFESVMAQNQAALDALDEILDCPCSRNSVLLIAVALVIFKMLGWYTACANAAPHTPKGQHIWEDSDSITPTSSLGQKPPIVRRPLQSTMQDYEIDIEYEDRVVCQIVLSSLYSVRRTLNVLTQQLTAAEERQGTPNSSARIMAAATENLLLEGPSFNSSSPSNLGQSLASNLSHHLHELCESIVGTLAGT
ncbi:aflatoxin regulatory protein-domain-containing protein [Phaeosphaeriaceae sp. PMI808]|nr:aflatoxin regulatory protein-domain-containing protein [Phaeosphaeriaceae sp. PMI808]